MRTRCIVFALACLAPSSTGAANLDLARGDPIPVLESSHRPGLGPTDGSDQTGSLRYPRLPDPTVPTFTPPMAKDTDLVAGGLQFGLLGAAAGAAVGLLLMDKSIGGDPLCPDCLVQLDDRESNTLFYGGVMGWALGSALGTHLANRGQGNLALNLATSLGLGWAGASLALKTGRNELLAPFLTLQFVASVSIERGTRLSRAE